MNRQRILLDTGPLVALIAETDGHHRLCVETLATIRPPLVTCWPVLTEAAYLLRKRDRSFDLLAEARTAGMFEIFALEDEALVAIASIMRQYQDARLQLADAALAYLADRENIRTVFTLDRRDFSIIRLKRNRTLKIIPEVR